MSSGSAKSSGWLTKILIILAIAVLAVILSAIVREVRMKRQISQEIDKLKAEAQKVERENITLSDKIKYLESIDYQEKEARDKLSLQGSGENVVIIKPGTVSGENLGEEPEKNREAVVLVRKSNVEKWWDYFFQY